MGYNTIYKLIQIMSVPFLMDPKFLKLESNSALLNCINHENWLNKQKNKDLVLNLSKKWLRNLNIDLEKDAKFDFKIPLLAEDEEIIIKDVQRTFSSEKYRNILVILLFNAKKKFGDYQQNLSYMAGFLLLFYNIGITYKVLTVLNSDVKYISNYWRGESIQPNIDGWVLFDIMSNYLPKLSRNFKKQNIQPNIISISQKWFGGCFIQNIPCPYLIDLMDSLFKNGIYSLFRFSLSVLKVTETFFKGETLPKIQAICRLLGNQKDRRLTYDLLEEIVNIFKTDCILDQVLEFDLLIARHKAFRKHLQTQLTYANYSELLIPLEEKCFTDEEEHVDSNALMLKRFIKKNKIPKEMLPNIFNQILKDLNFKKTI